MSEVAEISNQELSKTANQLIDMVEYEMIHGMVESGEFVLIQAPLEHIFTPGLYTRKITMPAYSRFTSSIHQSTHPFFVLKGKLSVFSEIDGVQHIEAPYNGITKPGTRRVLQIHEETIWITSHVTDVVPEDDSEEAKERAADLVMSKITELHENKLLGGYYKNSVFYESREELEFNNQNSKS